MENFKKLRIEIVPRSFLNAVTKVFRTFIRCFSYPCEDSTNYQFQTEVQQEEASKVLISL